MRQKVKNKVQLSIRNAFGENYRVEFFGSLRYHVSYRTSDLDMVILVRLMLGCFPLLY